MLDPSRPSGPTARNPILIPSAFLLNRGEYVAMSVSDTGRGSRFYILYPVLAERSTSQAENPSAETRTAGPDSSKEG